MAQIPIPRFFFKIVDNSFIKNKDGKEENR